jgi:protein-disulfide isomerase
MNKKHIVWVLVGAAAVGLVAGLVFKGAPRPVAKHFDDSRKRVPLEGSAGVKGPATALVNIVEFGDFECPFTSQARTALEKLATVYGDKLRFHFRNLPMADHAAAPRAAEAALAAGAQGKFWEMHDRLLKTQQFLKSADLERYAGELGLDQAMFKVELDGRKYKGRVDEDARLAKALGVQGTPTFFINGRELDGLQSLDAFKKVIDDELVKTAAIASAGLAPNDVYAKVLENTRELHLESVSISARDAREKQEARYRAIVGDAPTRGGKDPLVTIVEYADFQCPLCRKSVAGLEEVLAEYGDDVQLVFKHFPLRIHKDARAAAIAAEAARAQGRFWEMHDLLLANQEHLERASLIAYAVQADVKRKKFETAIDFSPDVVQRVDRDVREGTRLGVRGTPTFFVNGRMLVGSKSSDELRKIIDEEIRSAQREISAGTPRAEVYARLVELGNSSAPPLEKRRPTLSEYGVYPIDIGDSPTRGPKDALVTIVEFSDLQCPYCANVQVTLERLLQQYKGKVRIVWKDFPLPGHAMAVAAALAARAAGDQGRFWEMQRKLFEHQRDLSGHTIEKLGKELRLDSERFRVAVETELFKAAVDGDRALGQELGIAGTPAFFINGRFLYGAESFQAFKEKVDQALKEANRLISRGTPKGRVYDELMKMTRAEAAVHRQRG